MCTICSLATSSHSITVCQIWLGYIHNVSIQTITVHRTTCTHFSNMITAVCWNHLYTDWSQVSETRICVTTVIKATFLYRHWTGFHLWLRSDLLLWTHGISNKYCLILPSITCSFKAFTKVTKAVKCKKFFWWQRVFDQVSLEEEIVKS